MEPAYTLALSSLEMQMAVWTPLLGGGIGIATPLGISLKEFLCGQLKIPSQYLEQRIQTILVNSHPVDDVEQLLIADGDVIALSAAMPGLAGATLRRGGHLAPMRAAISRQRGQSRDASKRSGVVIVKLFNMVATEIGPRILAREIYIKGRDLADLRRQRAIAGDPGITAADEEWIRILPSGPA
jgi:hypothetical protein